MGLIETLDDVLNLCESSLWAFDIEKPEIPEEFHELFKELTYMVVQSVEALSRSSRAFRDFDLYRIIITRLCFMKRKLTRFQQN